MVNSQVRNAACDSIQLLVAAIAEDDAPPGYVRDEAAPSADYFDQLRELLEAEYQR